jgi:large subunit ribosomal protein L4
MTMNTTIYSRTGTKTGTIDLPASVFGVTWNADLVHEVVTGMQANARQSTAHTKDRGEVRGGGRKPWKQKGTGRARHGSRRSPIWAGGGIAHGPRTEKDYSVKLNKKVRAKALAAVLSKKLSDAEVILVDELSFSEAKAKEAKTVLRAIATAAEQTTLATKRKNAALVLLPERQAATELSFRNFGNIEVMQAKDVNPVDLLTYKFVVVAEPARVVEILEQRVAPVAKSNPV